MILTSKEDGYGEEEGAKGEHANVRRSLDKVGRPADAEGRRHLEQLHDGEELNGADEETAQVEGDGQRAQADGDLEDAQVLVSVGACVGSAQALVEVGRH